MGVGRVKTAYLCQECGLAPSWHSVKIGTVRVYDIRRGRWVKYTYHNFKLGEV